MHKQMGETAATNPALEVSVSFGRFASDSLSWEKWSTFSPNKYLEEVEKCKTPGSVAEKRAYFEAHYKKIAARKAELLDQEKQMENDSLRSGTDEDDGDDRRDANEDIYGTDTSKVWNSSKDTQQNADTINGTNCGMIEEPNEDDMITIECHGSFTEGQDVPETLSCKTMTEEPEEDNLVKDVVVEEVIYTCESQADVKEIQKDDENPEEDNEVKEAISLRKSQPDVKEIKKDFRKPEGKAAEEVAVQEAISPRKSRSDVKKIQKDVENVMIKTPHSRVANAKVNQLKNSQKINVVSKESHTPVAKKKSAPPVVKSPQVTTPRVTQPTPSTSRSSALKSSSKQGVSPSLSRRTTPSAGGSKKAVPKSLHMSISLNNTNTPQSTPSTARKSFIMESMGDKDIVRRAFKMFQNNRDQSKLSVEESAKQLFCVKETPKSLILPVPSSGTEQKLSASVAKAKVGGRSPFKPGNAAGKGSGTVSSTSNIRNAKYGERQKESMKKPDDSNAVKRSPQAKSKDVKKEAIRAEGRSPYLKTTVQGHSGQEKLKNQLQKEGHKNALNR